ncbi:protein D1-like [Phymastichus coffea]|uniref:protein D1-like n=1 Tax=Phymastichus coffea TaxID=108790 RepID=UPI00273BC2B5|nr:protein D1-like [Phymastichus coffea]
MANDALSKFQSEKIVPTLISTAPRSFLPVEYNGIQIEFGQELTPTLVKDIPKVTWNVGDSEYYTLCMADPDARLSLDVPPFQVLHWLVTNIPGNDIDKGDILAEYRGSGPPKGTGLHRYVFLLFKQPEKLQFDEKFISKTTRTGRVNYSVQNFVDKYKLGIPVAGNMYRAEYDDYVPTLYATYTD